MLTFFNEKKIIDLLIFFPLYFFPFSLMNFCVLDDTMWIDVCHSNGNLLASGGSDDKVKIFDKRESKIVQTFDNIHKSNIF